MVPGWDSSDRNAAGSHPPQAGFAGAAGTSEFLARCAQGHRRGNRGGRLRQGLWGPRTPPAASTPRGDRLGAAPSGMHYRAWFWAVLGNTRTAVFSLSLFFFTDSARAWYFLVTSGWENYTYFTDKDDKIKTI